MAILEVKSIKKSYKSFTLEVDMTLEDGELLTILGPSGSGKSTLMNILTGIEKPDSGSILLSGRDITNEKIQARDIGIVFQDYALFSNMNVEKNITYAMGKLPRREKKARVRELLELVGLGGYEKRNVAKLSGGEAQRVALARSLAAEPKLLLLDEPLSALDAPLRKKLRVAIAELQKKTKIPMIYITHDREEAFAVSDRMLVMKDGRIIASGSPEELYKRPKDLFSALFLGEGTTLPASLFFPGVNDTLFFRPEGARLVEREVKTEEFNSYIVINNTRLISSEFIGDGYLVTSQIDGYRILSRSPLKPNGEYVSILVAKDSILVFSN